MRSAHARSPTSLVAARCRQRPPRTAWLVARLRAPWLDRQLADGVATWASPSHAARALQLTGARSRRSWARSLERLVKHAEQPSTRVGSAVVPPCREQVREALPLILEIASPAARHRACGRRGNRSVERAAVRRERALLLTQRPRCADDCAAGGLAIARCAGLMGYQKRPAARDRRQLLLTSTAARAEAGKRIMSVV